MRLDTSSLTAAIAAFGNKHPQAMRRALKRTATAVKTTMTRLVAAETGLPSRRVGDEIKVTSDEIKVTLKVRGHRIPLIDFRARGPEPSRGKGRGVSYSLGGERKRLPHAFIATMPTGHRGVFERTGRFSKKPGVVNKVLSIFGRGARTTRETIAEKFGPSIAVVFGKFSEEGAARGREALMTNVKSQMERLTKTKS